MARQSEAKRIEKENELVALEFFTTLLGRLTDPRRKQGLRYPLVSVLMTALIAMVCGADDAQAMEDWGGSNEDWLGTFLELPHGVPTQDVYLAVFAAMDPDKFREVLKAWAELLAVSLKDQERHIAIDGKTSRHSAEPAHGRLAIHTVSAWLADRGFVLGAVKTAEKSNEITAIPELLKMLNIRRATITIDAMGCQREIAKTIIEGGGDYLLAVKDNQPALHAEIQETFKAAAQNSPEPRPFDEPPPPAIQVSTDVDKDHGRIEKRTVSLCRDLRYLIDSEERWEGLNFLAQVVRERTVVSTGKTSTEVAYCIGSDAQIDVQGVATKIRRHWSIENELHYILDMTFREDDARHRAGNCAQNMATLRHFAVNLLKTNPARKVGVKNTRLRAGWDHRFLRKILTSSRV